MKNNNIPDIMLEALKGVIPPSKNPFEPHSASYAHWQDGYDNPFDEDPYTEDCQPRDCFLAGQRVRKASD